MNLLKLFNPGRSLARIGHAKRKAASEKQRRELHDELTARLGLPPIPWAR